RLVQQWVIRDINQLRPFIPRDADREIIRIKSWPAHHGQNFSVSRIHRDDGAVLSFERLLGRNLQVDVDGQLKLLARYGGGFLESSNFFSPTVHDGPAVAVLAH